MGHTKRSNSSQPPYSALEPRVKNVSEVTIRKKWKKLPISSQDRVKEMLLSLKRQSAAHQGKGKAAMAPVQACVEEITDKLMQRLPKMPFPPSTDEQQFDYEATLQRISSLEYQLTDNIHSMNLLRSQIAKEEDLLKQDKAELKVLQENMRSAEGLRKRQEKTLHPLAQAVSLIDEGQLGENVSEDGQDERRITQTVAPSDPDLVGLYSQLRDHLESMQANTASMQPISRAIEDVQATLGLFTYQSLSPQTYSKVYETATQ